jgi:lipid-A-disaccharide synthase-like uncharacterized protein
MALTPSSWEYYFVLVLTIIILGMKFALSAYLGKKYLTLQKKGEQIPVFLKAMLIWIIFAFIARLFFSIFDFVLTKFDSTTYYLSPNIWFWKIGFVCSIIGLTYMLWIADKVLMQFKFKGIFVYIMIIGQIIVLLYPVDDLTDYKAVNAIGPIASIGLFIIPIIFFYLAYKTSGEIRRMAITLALGLILYAVGTALVSEIILDPLKGSIGTQIQGVMYLISTTVKIVGLLLLTYGAMKFHI